MKSVSFTFFILLLTTSFVFRSNGQQCTSSLTYTILNNSRTGVGCPSAAEIEFSYYCDQPYTTWSVMDQLAQQLGISTPNSAPAGSTIIVQTPAGLDLSTIHYFVATDDMNGTNCPAMAAITGIETYACDALVSYDSLHHETSPGAYDGSARFILDSHVCLPGIWTVTMTNQSTNEVFVGSSDFGDAEPPAHVTGLSSGIYDVHVSFDPAFCPDGLDFVLNLQSNNHCNSHLTLLSTENVNGDIGMGCPNAATLHFQFTSDSSMTNWTVSSPYIQMLGLDDGVYTYQDQAWKTVPAPFHSDSIYLFIAYDYDHPTCTDSLQLRDAVPSNGCDQVVTATVIREETLPGANDAIMKFHLSTSSCMLQQWIVELTNTSTNQQYTETMYYDINDPNTFDIIIENLATGDYDYNVFYLPDLCPQQSPDTFHTVIDKHFYADTDGDGYGDSTNYVLASLTGTNTPPPGYVYSGDDCNDHDASMHPGAPDPFGDETDSNCDGNFDDGCTPEQKWFTTFSQENDWPEHNLFRNNDGSFVKTSGSASGEEILSRFDTNGTLLAQHIYGCPSGVFEKAIRTKDNGYFFYGLTNGNGGQVSGFHGGRWKDVWLFKTDSIGNLQWQICLGDTGNQSAPYAMLTDSGDIIVSGTTRSVHGQPGDFSSSHDSIHIVLSTDIGPPWTTSVLGITPGDLGHWGRRIDTIYNSSEIWVAKISTAGSIKWLRCYGGSGNDELTSGAIELPDGSIVFSARTNSADGDLSGVYSGNVVRDSLFNGWGRDLSDQCVIDLGPYDIHCWYVLDPQWYYTSFSAYWLLGVRAESFYNWMAKLDVNGNISNSSILSLNGLRDIDAQWCQLKISQNEIVGSFLGYNQNYDPVSKLFKLDGNLGLQWERTTDLTGGFFESHPLQDGSIFCLKKDGSQMKMFSSTGTLQWEKAFPALNNTEIRTSTDTSIIFVGSMNGSTGGDAYMCKLNRFGTLKWQRIVSTPDDDWSVSGLMLDSNNFVLSGMTYSPSSNAYSSWIGKYSLKPDIIPSGPEINLCSGSSVTLSTSTSDLYHWNTGDSTQSITVHDSGYYQVNHGCYNSDSVHIKVRKITAYTVEGGGINCTVPDSGVMVWISDSDTGIVYQLLNDGIATGISLDGTGDSLLFGNQHAPGAYTVLAHFVNGCPTYTESMNGSATITLQMPVNWYLDEDEDGYYFGTPVQACESPGAGYSEVFMLGGDCDDSDPDVHPDAQEICDSIDNNCNGIIDEGCSLTINLDLRVLIQGFYQGSGQMAAVVDPVQHPLECDTIFVGLAEEVAPYTIVTSQIVIISTSGHAQVTFTNLQPGSYYIVIRHRNSLETWSASPVVISEFGSSYDFSDGVSRAYGNNLADLGDGNFALWSGDVNQDGIIELVDYNEIENNVQLFLSGYVNDDLTGDQLVESGDYSLIENNFQLFLIVERP